MPHWIPHSCPGDCPQRSLIGHLVLGAATLVQVVVLVGYVLFFSGASPGFAVVAVLPGENRILAFPTTQSAMDQVPASRADFTSIRRINGHSLLDVPEGESYARAIREWLDLREGARNTFVVSHDDRLVTATLPVERPQLGVWLANPRAYYPVLGWLYLACGGFIWWRRHTDRAALPLLYFTAVASVQMAVPAANVWVGHPLEFARFAVMPLYGSAGLALTLAFTGFHVRRAAFAAKKVVLAMAVLLCAALFILQWMVTRAHGSYEPWLDAAYGATGVFLLGAVLVMVGFCWAASRPPHPLGLRRRALLMAKAILLAFAIPSLYLSASPFLPPDVHGPMAIVVLVLMGTFPLMLVYAIVRHQMFDLRIVLRQGAVYGALSLLVTLGYLVLVVVAVKGLGRHAESPFVIGLAAVVLVLVASVLKLKVQNAVDRVVFRARYVYADAVATASEKLSRARSLEAITDTVRGALIDAMKLSRAYFAVREGHENDSLRCFTLGNRPDPQSGRLPPELPSTLLPVLLAPVARTMGTMRVATSYDSNAASAQVAQQDTDAKQSIHDEYGEDTFWSQFGIEAIVPMTIGEEDERVVGLLLLGPKLSERQLDPEDQKLLTTLANQLAVALENAHAFEEIEWLKSDLERQVEERTRELRETLKTLSDAQSQLIESQKQAMLGRLVAGIVHEVNSPLGALSSSADTIRRSLARVRGYVEDQSSRDAGRLLRALDTGQELTDVIRSGSSRINSLMTSLSSFVSLDQADYRTFDVREGIGSALTLLEPQLGEGVQVECALPADPIAVRGSATKLNQALLNLLQNAVTALDGSGTLRVRATRFADRVEIEIEDDGVGIAPERLERLFDFGFTTKSGGRIGLGLGLPTSKRTIEEVGGSLSIQSEVGRGTLVRVVLPTSLIPANEVPPPN